jgi:outer membrane protein OmpA-like peptidoglycan-associated protein
MRQRRLLCAVLGLGAVCAALLVANPSQAVPTDYPPSPPAINGGPGSGNPNPQPSEPPADFERRDAVLVVDGVSSTVRIKRDNNTGTYRITGDNIDMTLNAVGPAGTPLPLGADGSLLLIPGGNLQASGKGFAPTSTIVLWLLSTPIRLGNVQANSAGAVRVNTTIPLGVAPGLHHAQAFGYTSGGQELRATVPVRVLSRPLEVHQQRLETTVYFGELDSTVVPGERQAIDAMIAKMSPSARKVRVTVAGFVQPSSTSTNDMALSTRRAIAVARYLKKNGVPGAYVVSGRGVSSTSGTSARHAEVRIVVTVLS